MPAFIRYPFFGCVILALSACGSSGSSRLLEPEAPPMDPGMGMEQEPVDVTQRVYSSVEYLLTDIPAAVDKFAKQVYKDAAGNKYLLTSDNVDNMNLTGVDLPMGVTTAPNFADLLAVYQDAEGNEYLLTPDDVDNMDLTNVDLPMGVMTAPDFADLTKTREGARGLTSTPAQLDTLRNAIVNISSRYLSTGTVLVRTDDNNMIMTERPSYDAMGDPDPDPNVGPNPAATCEDASATGPAKCVFGVDSLREAATTFHLGSVSSSGEDQVSFRSFRADREPVMYYRDTFMSQVRTAATEEFKVYEDGDGNKYLLTNENVTGTNLTGVELPMGVTTAPDFADLLAVYRDESGNKYLLTPANVASMDLMGVELPMGVMTAPDFMSLSEVTENRVADDADYVGYDGILKYSMFFVGVDRFYDDDGDLMHMRLGHASLGQIYDEDAVASDIQSPSVALTGEGVMVGVERLKADHLEHHLVQGDVNINYSPFIDAVEEDRMADPVVEAVAQMDAMIDISITNVQRLADDSEAWYGRQHRRAALNWSDVLVTESQFKFTQGNKDSTSPGTLNGSFYGTEQEPEVGGVFHHEDVLYEIIGAFGSKLAPVPVMDPEDPMNPMQ